SAAPTSIPAHAPRRWRPGISCASPSASPRAESRPRTGDARRGKPYNRHMSENHPYTIDVQVRTRFVPDQSRPDANGKVEEVRGDGVVGEQPWMRPGDNFEYTSGAVLETPVGTMGGSYLMLADDGTRFEAPIPSFTLSIPRTLH